MLMEKEAIITFLREALGDDSLPDDIPGLLDILHARFGTHEEVGSQAEFEEKSFSIGDDRRLNILIGRTTGQLIGGFVQKQRAPPPCPTPGPMGVMVVTGSSTDTYTFPFVGDAYVNAGLWAAITWIMSYRAIVPIKCRPCAPPCTCVTTFTAAPTITKTHVFRWRWGIPVGGRVTVTISVPVAFNCV